MTDISNEPDDEQSLVRFLIYANEYDIEGMIASTSIHLKTGIREDLIHRQIEAYAKVQSNLSKHAKGYPEASLLSKKVASGQKHYGMSSVGKGLSTTGSNLILHAADQNDSRPIWVCAWGGTNTLAQALWDAKQKRSAASMKKLISKLKVYAINDQDDSGRWLRLTFPELFYIVTPTSGSWKESYKATWTGISGDRFFKNGPGYYFNLVSNPWLQKNISHNHGPLGKLYPKTVFIMEGDTSSFLGLIPNGLGWSANPAYGGWGGRYAFHQSYAESRPIWTENMLSRDSVKVNGKLETSHQASIWRWRKHFQHDFAARMDWCIQQNYKDANHNPVAVLNHDISKKILYFNVDSGSRIKLTAKGSYDPDGDAIKVHWQVYHEAGSIFKRATLSHQSGNSTEVIIPKLSPRTKKEAFVHIILTVEDQGSPNLVAYRRAILKINKK